MYKPCVLCLLLPVNFEVEHLKMVEGFSFVEPCLVIMFKIPMVEFYGTGMETLAGINVYPSPTY